MEDGGGRFKINVPPTMHDFFSLRRKERRSSKSSI